MKWDQEYMSNSNKENIYDDSDNNNNNNNKR
jgi:hypothetical protein